MVKSKSGSIESRHIYNVKVGKKTNSMPPVSGSTVVGIGAGDQIYPRQFSVFSGNLGGERQQTRFLDPPNALFP